MKPDIHNYLKLNSKIVTDWLNIHLNGYSDFSSGLTESMRYSIFAGGKYLRPSLIIAAYSIFKDDVENIVPFAAAIELIHTYSLVHDDLPAMDNDDLRRGKPTNHKIYGEAVAILAGDALLTKAFYFMSKKYSDTISDEERLKAIELLSKLAGDEGMVAGQYVDIVSEGKPINIDALDFIHLNKTAALIKYCTSAGAILAGATDKDVEKLQKFGEYIGLAFQIVDDILDITSTSAELGKNTNSDIQNDKLTYPKLMGLELSKRKAEELILNAEDIISGYGEKARYLLGIANFITNRRY